MTILANSAVDFIGRNVKSARAAVSTLDDGAAIHGMTDGRWSLSDLLFAISQRVPNSDLTISTWTAASADLSMAQHALEKGAFRSLRLLVDRSFLTRQPAYCAKARELFGDDAIRVWSSHAKFAIFCGGQFDVLLLSSMNLNQNRRLESFSIFGGGPLPRQYLAVVDDLYASQRPTAGFDAPARARRDMGRVMRKVKTPADGVG